MPRIALPEGVPGIRSAFQFRPETARPMLDLAEVLLRGDNTLTPGEREIIATHVSHRNGCHFCMSSHRAAAAHLLDRDYGLVDAAVRTPESAPISDKLRALLVVAGQVAESGRAVTDEAVEAARAAGATDREIHDAVLIAAAFCMFNRYVDGLAALTPHDDETYDQMGALLARAGYAGRPPAAK